MMMMMMMMMMMGVGAVPGSVFLRESATRQTYKVSFFPSFAGTRHFVSPFVHLRESHETVIRARPGLLGRCVRGTSTELVRAVHSR
jgi:hypothetical protein